MLLGIHSTKYLARRKALNRSHIRWSGFMPFFGVGFGEFLFGHVLGDVIVVAYGLAGVLLETQMHCTGK